MRIKTYHGETFTEVAPGEWLGEQYATPWDVVEIRDIKSKIRWCTQEMAKMVRAGLDDEDNAAAYVEALEIRTSDEEDLELLEFLAA